MESRKPEMGNKTGEGEISGKEKGDITLRSVFSEVNQETAMHLVVRKDPIPGLDGMPASKLPEYWKMNRTRILAEIAKGSYIPTPCKVFFKMKRGKKEKRKITVYSPLDQMLQHCIRFEIDRCFADRFHPRSYGFCVGRGTFQAVNQCLKYMNHGWKYVVDADIRKCFERIKHKIVLDRLRTEIGDSRVIRLISVYIKNPSIMNNRIIHNRIGLNQGACISPVLANVTLNSLDWYLHRERIPFVRYADDIVLFARTRQQAKIDKEKLEKYLNDKLSLELNEEKTNIIPAEKLEYLGFGFQLKDNRYQFSVPQSAKERLSRKMLHHLRKKYDEANDLLKQMGSFNRGWAGYYQKVSPEQIVSFLGDSDKEELTLLEPKLRELREDIEYPRDELDEIKSFVTLSDWYQEMRDRLEYGIGAKRYRGR